MGKDLFWRPDRSEESNPYRSLIDWRVGHENILLGGLRLGRSRRLRLRRGSARACRVAGDGSLRGFRRLVCLHRLVRHCNRSMLTMLLAAVRERARCSCSVCVG